VTIYISKWHACKRHLGLITIARTVRPYFYCVFFLFGRGEIFITNLDQNYGEAGAFFCSKIAQPITIPGQKSLKRTFRQKKFTGANR